MQAGDNLLWMEINDFFLDIGKERNPRDFCVKLLNRIASLVPYDNAVICILNDNLKVKEQLLIGKKQKWSDLYFDYYSKVEDGRFSLRALSSSEYMWGNFEDCEFKKHFIKPQGVNCTSIIKLSKIDYWPSVVFSIQRVSKCEFSQREKTILSILRPHLCNLYKNFFISTPKFSTQGIFINATNLLTERESMIVDLLSTGMSPAQISERCFISLRTVYNHLAHIYGKFNVSSQRELLVKLGTVTKA